jgi:hypothetical protein
MTFQEVPGGELTRSLANPFDDKPNVELTRLIGIAVLCYNGSIL